MSKTVVSTSEAPGAVGPYSQAVAAGGFLFCSGQIGLDPESGGVAGDAVAEQTRRCLDNLAAVLRAGGSDLDRVVKVNAYLTDLPGDFAEFNEAYEGYFGPEPPARATIGVAALPKGAKVEIECVALV